MASVMEKGQAPALWGFTALTVPVLLFCMQKEEA